MFRITLKSLREQAGYSQAAFAKQIGHPQSTIGGWEAGRREPNIQTMQKIADFFGVSIDYLINGEETDTKKEPPSENDDPDTARIIELLAQVKEINPDTYAHVVHYIELLAQDKQ